MIINEKLKFIFVHVPKTAGTSMHMALEGKDIQPRHKYASDIDIRYKDYFKFAFIRNPWDWLLSIHTYCVKRNIITQPDFRIWLLKEEFWEGEGAILGDSCLPYQRRPITRWIMNEQDEIIIDFVGKYENMFEDMGVLGREHGISFKPLKHINETIHAPYQEVYDDEMREFVAHNHKILIDRFGYEF